MNELTNYDSDNAKVDQPGMEKLKAKVGEAVEPVKAKAAQAARQAAREQKEAGASHLQTFAQAVHGAAREFESPMPKVADLIHEAGDQIDRMATNIRDKSLEDILNSVRDFARQQPALVFGGAMLAGLVLSRFLKSSTSHTRAQDDYYKGTQRNYYGSDPSYDTAREADYGVAGRPYNEQTPRPN
jgi:hypothetical protein